MSDTPYRNAPSPWPGCLRLFALTCCAVFSLNAQAQVDDRFPLLSFFAPPPAAVSTPAAVVEEELRVEEVKAYPTPSQTIDLTVAPNDLWVRIRNGFAMPNLYDDLVTRYQNWYESRPEALRRMVERSRPYLHFIVEEIEARGLPTELALLPMVESSFNPMAYSRSHASGLWQFIPATGKRFNLEQNWWQDQRRDVMASTQAALDYLQTIYELNGDWHLALASYNWGEGAVKRAMEKNAARGLPTDYISLNMPQETRHYVPKLQALKNIFSDPLLMAQLRLPAIPNRPYLARIEVPSAVDVKKAARLAGMPLNEFLALNPSHNRPVIKPDTPVVVPAEKLDTFQYNLENSEEPLSEWQAYTLRPGERLDKLAPRFGIKLSDLKRVNGLSGRTSPGTGMTLLVPNGSGGVDLDDLPMLPPPAAEEPIKPLASANARLAKAVAAATTPLHGKHGKPAAVTTGGKPGASSGKVASAAKGAGATRTDARSAKGMPAKGATGLADKKHDKTPERAAAKGNAAGHGKPAPATAAKSASGKRS